MPPLGYSPKAERATRCPRQKGTIMKIATGLALMAVGAILTFAVTANTSVFNLHIAGVVIMLTGLAGLIMSRRQYDWLRRRMIILPRRRGKRTGAVVDVVE